MSLSAKTISALRSFPRVTPACSRLIHSSKAKQDASVGQLPVPDSIHKPASTSALAHLPLSQILRTYLVTSISSSPALLDASSRVLRRLIDSDSTLLSLEKNPVLRAVLWETFYKQFCAGETAEEITEMCNTLRQQGYAGVILEYALEVLKDTNSSEVEDVAVWKSGMLRSIEMTAPGDFIGLKWSGMGSAALRRLGAKQDPSYNMHDAMVTVCQAAAHKGVALLPSAEETWTLEGYYHWSLMMQKQFNRFGKSVIYNTYQAYLRQVPGILSKHMEAAKAADYTLGVKVVRGAYLFSEKRELIHSTIEDTHAAYDGIASSLVERKYNDVLTGSADLPPINVVLATHNAESVRKAKGARQRQSDTGVDLTPLCFAQLQGMADEVSCSLLSTVNSSDVPNPVTEKVFKCTTWGTMTQCLNYLLRRAAENKDAASRTADTRWAMQKEMLRRLSVALTPA